MGVVSRAYSGSIDGDRCYIELRIFISGRYVRFQIGCFQIFVGRRFFCYCGKQGQYILIYIYNYMIKFQLIIY